jgi:hypothetical protein
VVVVATLLYYAIAHVRHRFDTGELAAGVWLVAHLALVYVVSFVGSFGGRHWLHGPWDSVVVGAVSLLIYTWGIRAGGAYLEAHPEIVEELHHSHDAWEEQPVNA